VAVPVPKGVQGINIEQVEWSDTIGYYPGMYSAVLNPDNPPFLYFDSMEGMDQRISSDYYWGFPSGADRNLSAYLYVTTDEEFQQNFDSVTSDDAWNFSPEGLSLKSGETSGEYFSEKSTFNGVNITAVEMSWSIDANDENATFEVSNNNGTNWMEVTHKRGEPVNFETTGIDLTWRVNMTQDPSLNNTPVLGDLWVNVTYTPWYTDIILQLGYVLQKNSDKGRFDVVLDLYDDHVNGVNPHVVIYINKDHEIDSDNLPLTNIKTQTEYPDKDAYVFMTGEYSVEAPITIKEKDEGFPLILLLSVILIACIAGIILLLVLGKRKPSASPDTEEPADSEDMEELRHKKEGLLIAIKKLDSDYEEGVLDEDTYKELRASYKAKAVEVTKELHRIKGR
jgi:hypothetical protein